MKKYFMIIVALMLFTSCSGQKQLNLFDKNTSIDSFRVFDYVPLYSSFLPEGIRVIEGETEIEFIRNSINRAQLVEKKVKPTSPISDLDTFDIQISTTGANVDIFPIFILFEGEDIYLSSIDFYNSEKQEYTVYQIQSSDVDEFRGFLKALE